MLFSAVIKIPRFSSIIPKYAESLSYSERKTLRSIAKISLTGRHLTHSDSPIILSTDYTTKRTSCSSGSVKQKNAEVMKRINDANAKEIAPAIVPCNNCADVFGESRSRTLASYLCRGLRSL